MGQRDQVMHTTILPTVGCTIINPDIPLDSYIYLVAGHFHMDVLLESQSQCGLILLFFFPVLTHVS